MVHRPVQFRRTQMDRKGERNSFANSKSLKFFVTMTSYRMVASRITDGCACRCRYTGHNDADTSTHLWHKFNELGVFFPGPQLFADRQLSYPPKDAEEFIRTFLWGGGKGFADLVFLDGLTAILGG